MLVWQMIRADLLAAVVFALAWGWVCLYRAPTLQRLAARLPKPLKYVFFEAFGWDPMCTEVYMRYRFVGTVFIAIGIIVTFVVIGINVAARL